MIWRCRLQTDGMSCVEPTRRTINGLPPRRPFAGVTVVWRCIESQAGNHSECVTFSCVDRDPFAGAAVAVVAKLRGAHRRADQAPGAQYIGDRSRTIVAAVIKRFMAATVTIWLVAKLIGCPDCAFHGDWRILWRTCFAKTKARRLARHNRSRGWKKIGYCRWNDPRENSDDEQDSMANRTDRFPPGSCRMPKTLRMKRKKLGGSPILTKGQRNWNGGLEE